MEIVKITNKIALITVLGMIYWVFILSISVIFNLNIFGENIIELFFLSLLGMFSVLAGAIVLNIMFNLTTIAEHKNLKKEAHKEHYNFKKYFCLFVASFFIITSLLFCGEYYNSKRKEDTLIKSANSLIESKRNTVDKLMTYSFTQSYINMVSEELNILNKIDINFPYVSVIVMDNIHDNEVFLIFNHSHYKNKELKKIDYIFSSSKEDREYLNTVFKNGNKNYKIELDTHKREIYFPIQKDGKSIVLYLSKYDRYGKIGS